MTRECHLYRIVLCSEPTEDSGDQFIYSGYLIQSFGFNGIPRIPFQVRIPDSHGQSSLSAEDHPRPCSSSRSRKSVRTDPNLAIRCQNTFNLTVFVWHTQFQATFLRAIWLAEAKTFRCEPSFFFFSHRLDVGILTMVILLVIM